MPQFMQETSIFKPVILAGLNAITPVFGPSYVDEFGQPETVQLRGAFSTERRQAPNIVVSYKPGSAMFNTGQNIIGFDESSGLFKYGFYMADGQLKYAVQARNELEREWLLDTLLNGFTGLVFVDPVSGTMVNNNLVNYLGSQGIVVKGVGDIDYPNVIQSDTESPRPEGQVWEATLPFLVDVSLTYYMPGVSASNVTLSNTANPDQTLPASLPWEPMPNTNPSIFLSFP